MILYIIVIVIGILCGIIIGCLCINKPIYKGPESNKIKKIIHVDDNGQCYKFIPQIVLSINKRKNN